MSDLVFVDKLTLKRNTALQNRLQVRLQIIGEEYRMAKKDLEQHTRDMADFLVYVRHTAPGLSAYRQPDTRAMKAENALKKLCSRDRQANDRHKILHRQKSHNKETERGKYECCWGKEERGVSSGHERAGGVELNCLVHYSEPSSKNDHAPDQENSCRLQRPMYKKNSCSAESENYEPRKPYPGSCCRNDSLAEAEVPRRLASLHQGHRVQSAKYGRSAYTQKDEILRHIIFRRFEAIFDARDEKQQDKMSYIKLASPSDESHIKDILAAPTCFPLREHRQQISYTKDKSSSSQIATNRLTWSAPHRRHVLTTRPGTSAKITNQQLHTASLPPDCWPSCSDPAEMQTAQETYISLVSEISLGEQDTDVRSRACQQPQKTSKRPKTAPSNYELKQKSVPAPRQQVAGFQAEAHSRRFATRVIVKKSRQLQQMVKMLAPSEQSDDNSTD